jgi:hypothetical protein
VDLVVIFAVVSSLVKVIAAFCTTAPDESVTVPVTSPRSSCAVERQGTSRKTSRHRMENKEPAKTDFFCAFTFASKDVFCVEGFSFLCGGTRSGSITVENFEVTRKCLPLRRPVYTLVNFAANAFIVLELLPL